MMISVLIVEDDPMVREINEGFLSKVQGYTLYKSVSTIEEAKKELLAGKPDLVLLDVFFPQGLGTDLLKWVRANNIKCDVILITADKNIDTVEEALRYGVVDYIVKPFTFNRFREALLQYRNRKTEFKSIEKVEQESIDKMIFKDKEIENDFVDGSDIKDMKGISQHTYEKIVKCILGMKGETITAQELADLTGVSRITARRYLTIMEDEGKIALEMEYGKVGRPSNKYKIKK